MNSLVSQIRTKRVANLRVLISRFRTAAEFARHYGLDPTYVSQLLTGHRPIGERAARTIEAACRLSPGALDGEETDMLTDEERDWLTVLGQLTDAQKQALRHVADTMRTSAPPVSTSSDPSELT